MNELEIAALADGELKGNDKVTAEQEVANDPAARAHFQGVMAVKETLKTKLPSHNCKETWSKCVGRLDELERASRTESIVGRFSYAMAAVLIVAIFSAAYLNRTDAQGFLDRGSLQRITASAAGAGGSLSVDPRLLEYFNKELRTDPRTAVSARDLRPIRLERIQEGERWLGRIIYTDGFTEYVLVVIPGAQQLPGEPVADGTGRKYLSLGSTNVVLWQAGDTSYALAAEKPISTLLKLIE